MQTFLDLARQGKNEWWRYVLAVVLILFMWQILGAMPSAFLLFVTFLRLGSKALDLPINPATSYTAAGFVAIMLASVFFMGGIYLALRFIHRRPFRTLVTVSPRLDWRRLLQGFGVWFGLAALMSGLEALLYPGRYVWTNNLGHFLPFVALALLFIPIQTSAEELFFRSYVLQGVGLRLRNIWLLSAISGVLFGLPHLLNPEASINYPLLALYYISFGFALAYITLREGRLELALGAHAANNLFSVLIANYAVTALPSPSLFSIRTLDAVFSVPVALLGLLVFIYLFIGPWRRESSDKPAMEH